MMIIVGPWPKDNARNLEISDRLSPGYLRCLPSEGGLVSMGMFHHPNVNSVDITYPVALLSKYNLVSRDVV